MCSHKPDNHPLARATADSLSTDPAVINRGQRSDAAGAFTLVEVVLAIGVLSIAVLSLLLMFAPTMESIQGNIAQTDAIDSTSAINEFLEEQAKENGFTDLYDTFTSKNDEPFYVFTQDRNDSDDAVVEQLTFTDEPADLTTAVNDGVLIGNALRVELSEVDDNPYDYTDGITNDPILPMRVTIYQVSDPTNPATGGVEAFEYNTAVLR